MMIKDDDIDEFTMLNFFCEHLFYLDKPFGDWKAIFAHS